MSPRQLQALIEGWFQGKLTPEQRLALEKHLMQSSEARRHFRRSARLDSSLRDWASRDQMAGVWTGQQASSAGGRNWVRIAYGVLALAACVALAAIGWRPPAKPAPRVEQTALGCAVLTRLVDVEWGTARSLLRSGDTLATGRLSLKKGLARIEFFSGATLLLEGPAELDVVSSWEAICHQGKVRVRVPPAAQGFRLRTPDLLLVDLGTEFGTEVGAVGTGSRVYVFEGEVEAHLPGTDLVNLKTGEGVQALGGFARRISEVGHEEFVNEDRLISLGREHQQARFSEWKTYSEQQREDARLIAYYPMQRGDGWDRLVQNAALPRNGARDGGAVGATWSIGRWPDKHALEFKRPGDRVRLNIDGTYNALTFACWVKVDGLDRKYNALVLTDGYEAGEPHWQIYEDGRLMFSLTYPKQTPESLRNRIYYSPVIFDGSTTGRWHHIAVTYENSSGEVVQYVDGNEVSREVDQEHVPGRPVVYGACELGNWGIPSKNHPFPIRNLNGSLDEFAIFSTALSVAEIRALYNSGRPE